MMLSLLAAVAENGVIGRGNDLPWHLPADLARFKALTVGHTIIMGRKTYESIGRVLPDRRTIVLTRGGGSWEGVETAASLAEALAMAEVAGETEAFVVGGAAVYREALPEAERVYLTRVHAEIAGDVHFPSWDPGAWRLGWEEGHEADARHAYRYSFQRWERRRDGRARAYGAGGSLGG